MRSRRDKISRGGLYAAIKRGEVPNLRLGHRILIPRFAFMRWLGTAEPPAAGKVE